MNVYDLVLLIVGGILIFIGVQFLLKSNFGKSAMYGSIGLAMLISPFLHEKAIEVLIFELLILGTLFAFAGITFLLNLDFGKSTIHGGIALTKLTAVCIYVIYFLPMS